MTYPPLFSVVIPTLGRETLARTLASIDRGLAEAIVVVDTFDMGDDPHRVDRVKLQCGPSVRVCELDAGRHDTGSPQLHLGYMLASGAWVMNCGDDDVYVDGAFSMLSQIVIPDHTAIGPLMFKVEMHPGPQRGNTVPVTLWERPEIARFNVSGQMFVTPNDKRRMGRWVDDVTFIDETVRLWGGRIEWREELLCRCY